MRVLQRAVYLLVIGALLGGCAAAMLNKSAGSRPAPTSDAAITATIESRLAGEPGIPAGSVRVSSSQGVVTLSGLVAGDAERRRAEQLARTVSGVRAVRNQLAVRQ